ncbi:MFS general substrate transporter [Hypoxylon sp. FL0890]|nr:MFS general substrate transporter [Hypoxylon sp. FL0890]
MSEDHYVQHARAASVAPPGVATVITDEAALGSENEIPQSNQVERQLEPQPEVVFTPPSRTARNGSQSNLDENQIPMANARRQITPGECGDRLGFRWPLWKKWCYLNVIFLVQVSMNLNTTLYSNGIDGISLEYGITPFEARWGGASSFLMTYAFGCELWAPWSEEFGRKAILQSSLGFVNCFAVLVATSPNLIGHIIGRALGGLSSAGGSVTLAVISDMFDSNDPMFQHAASFIVFSSVSGSIFGPIIGGFAEAYLAWRWCIWIQVIFGAFVQLLHLFIVPETRSTVIMDRVAREYRKSGKDRNVFGPSEIANKRIDWADVGKIWLRPFRMFLTEPIVIVFSLLSGFSDALIFMMVQSFGFVYWQYGFSPVQVGLCFIPIGIGYLAAFVVFFFFIRRNVSLRAQRPQDEYAQYEARLLPLLWTAPLLPIGLLVFAFTAAYSTTPIHWFPSMIGSFLIGIANFAIYMATIDYVLRAYGPYAASATGGNGWARDFLAGLLTPYAIPMYVHYKLTTLFYLKYEKLSVFMATIILVVIATVLCGAVFLVYKYGPWLRRHSKFAQTLAEAEADQGIVVGSSSDENFDIELNNINRTANASLPRPSFQSPVWYQLHRRQNIPLQPSSLRQSSDQGQESQQVAADAEVRTKGTTSSRKSCTCSSERTLTGTCSFCKTAGSTRTRTTSEPTSLREVENAVPPNEAETEEEPAIAPPATLPPATEDAAGNEPNGLSQDVADNGRKAHCSMM